MKPRYPAAGSSFLATILLLAVNLGADALPSEYANLKIIMENAQGKLSGNSTVQQSQAAEQIDLPQTASLKEDSPKPEKNKPKEQKEKYKSGADTFYRILEKIGVLMQLGGGVGAGLKFVNWIWKGTPLTLASLAGWFALSLAGKALAFSAHQNIGVEPKPGILAGLAGFIGSALYSGGLLAGLVAGFFGLMDLNKTGTVTHLPLLGLCLGAIIIGKLLMAWAESRGIEPP